MGLAVLWAHGRAAVALDLFNCEPMCVSIRAGIVYTSGTGVGMQQSSGESWKDGEVRQNAADSDMRASSNMFDATSHQGVRPNSASLDLCLLDPGTRDI